MAREQTSVFPHHRHWARPNVPVLQQRFVFWVIVVVLGAAQATLAVSPVIGSFVSVIVFGGCLAAAEVLPRLRPLMVICSVLPLLSLVNLILPEMDSSLRMVVYYSVLLLLTLVYSGLFFGGYIFRRDKLRYNYRLLFGVLAVGVIMGLIVFALTGSDYSGISHMPLLILLPAVIAFAATEELFFRGLLQRRAAKILTPDQVVLLPAIIYALSTLSASSFWTPLIAFVTASVLSIIYNYRPNLTITFVANATMKLVAVLLLVLSSR